MPGLRTLLIGKNRLVSVRDFRKLFRPHFKNIDMESNYVADCHKLTELLTEDEMHELDLEWYKKSGEMCPNARWIVKLKPRRLVNLCTDAVIK